MTTTYKLVVIGDAQSGKSSLLFRFVHRQYNASIPSTICASFYSKILPTGERVNMWDTAGQERYRSLLPMYLKDINLILYVYDITSKKSFDNLKNYWVDWANNNATINPTVKDTVHICPGILVGNKTDLAAHHREVSSEEASKLAEKLDIPFIETSVKEGRCVDKVWKIVQHTLLMNRIPMESNVEKSPIILLEISEPPKVSTSCLGRCVII